MIIQCEDLQVLFIHRSLTWNWSRFLNKKISCYEAFKIFCALKQLLETLKFCWIVGLESIYIPSECCNYMVIVHEPDLFLSLTRIRDFFFCISTFFLHFSYIVTEWNSCNMVRDNERTRLSSAKENTIWWRKLERKFTICVARRHLEEITPW